MRSRLFLESCQSTNNEDKCYQVTPPLGLFWKCQCYPSKIACVRCHPAWPGCHSAEVSIISARYSARTGKLLKYHMEPFQIISSEPRGALPAVSKLTEGANAGFQWKTLLALRFSGFQSHRSQCHFLRFLGLCTCSKCVMRVFHVDVYQVVKMLPRWSWEGREVVGCGPQPSTTASIPPFLSPALHHTDYLDFI